LSAAAATAITLSAANFRIYASSVPSSRLAVSVAKIGSIVGPTTLGDIILSSGLPSKRLFLALTLFPALMFVRTFVFGTRLRKAPDVSIGPLATAADGRAPAASAARHPDPTIEADRLGVEMGVPNEAPPSQRPAPRTDPLVQRLLRAVLQQLCPRLLRNITFEATFPPRSQPVPERSQRFNIVGVNFVGKPFGDPHIRLALLHELASRVGTSARVTPCNRPRPKPVESDGAINTENVRATSNV
jgi:hypothetical protein